ncbi:acyl carrier protein [Amycolatopsis sp. NPDC005003]
MQFTMTELLDLLFSLTGEAEAPDRPAEELADLEFAELGIDSLALFNALHRIEQKHGVELPADIVIELETPRDLFDEVVRQLAIVA